MYAKFDKTEQDKLERLSILAEKRRLVQEHEIPEIEEEINWTWNQLGEAVRQRIIHVDNQVPACL